MTPEDLAAGLPGAELVLTGLTDLREGRDTTEALLVAIGAPRLRRIGLDVPDLDDPEHSLYARLAAEHGAAAHGRYNSLVRRLVAYELAGERRVSAHREWEAEIDDTYARMQEPGYLQRIAETFRSPLSRRIQPLPPREDGNP